MATPQNLETLLSTVDRSVCSLEAEIQSAQEEVAAAKRAVGELQACSARNISIESFQSVADQKTIADLLGSLRKVLDEAAVSDRAEAALWTQLSTVIEQMARAARDWQKSQTLLRVKEGSLAEREHELKQSIAELSAAEPTEQKNQRRRTFIASAVIGAALLPATILVQRYLIYPGQYWPLILGAAAAAAAFLMAWYSIDAHRARKLAGGKSRPQLQVRRGAAGGTAGTLTGPDPDRGAGRSRRRQADQQAHR